MRVRSAWRPLIARKQQPRNNAASEDPSPEKKSAQACSLRADELIDKGAIITGE
jgi:hypothetical protein